MTWEFEEEVESLVVYVADKGDEVLYAVWDYNKVMYISSQKMYFPVFVGGLCLRKV